MAIPKKTYRTKGKGLSHPAVKVLILLNLIAWGIGLYLYFNEKPDFENESQIASQSVELQTNEVVPTTSDSINKKNLEIPDPTFTQQQKTYSEKKDSVASISKPIAAKIKVDTQTLRKEVIRPSVNKPVRNNSSKITYTVAKGQAHFHNLPDPSTRRKAFINHWNKAVLEPLEEKNGFIYIIYTNHQGQTSKGWLQIKDLKPLANR